MTTTPNADDVPFKQRTFKIFDSRQTIGVETGYGGVFRGLYLSPAVKKMKERQLAQEILAVAGVASARGRLCMREEMIASAAATDQHVNSSTFELLPGVPTAEEYETLRRETLKY
jgi:hypothetical protein